MSIQGTTEPGWEAVAETMGDLIDRGVESGAAVAVYQHGEPVVDVWGGTADADSGRLWKRDTAACVFSATKGATAICAHLLVQRGLLDLEAPVATYWPEFAQAGKQDLKVRWLLTHQAGLHVLDADLTFDDLRAVEPVLRAIEAQTPVWEPGTHVGYHAVTYGHLVGEVIRRVAGCTLGEFFAAEIVGPLGLQAWIGLPKDEPVDLARMGPPPWDPSSLFEHLDPAAIAAFAKVITLGSAVPLSLIDGRPGDFNDRALLAIELGASGMVTDARSLARMYAATVSDVDGLRLFDADTAASCAPIQTSATPVFGTPPELVDTAPRGLDFALGFIAGDMLGPTSFGHNGASGCLAFADLDAGIGFAYVTNRMGGESDSRSAELVDAVRQCLSPVG